MDNTSDTRSASAAEQQHLSARAGSTMQQSFYPAKLSTRTGDVDVTSLHVGDLTAKHSHSHWHSHRLQPQAQRLPAGCARLETETETFAAAGATVNLRRGALRSREVPMSSKSTGLTQLCRLCWRCYPAPPVAAGQQEGSAASKGHNNSTATDADADARRTGCCQSCAATKCQQSARSSPPGPCGAPGHGAPGQLFAAPILDIDQRGFRVQLPQEQRGDQRGFLVQWSQLGLWEKPHASPKSATASWRFHHVDMSSSPADWTPALQNRWEVASGNTVAPSASASSPSSLGQTWPCRTGHLEVKLRLACPGTCQLQLQCTSGPPASTSASASTSGTHWPVLLPLGHCTHICLEHQLDPLPVLQGPAPLVQSADPGFGPRPPLYPRSQFWPSAVVAWPCCELYAAAWRQLCLMEATVCAVADSDTKLLGGVCLRWADAAVGAEDASTVVGGFSVPEDLAAAHNLKFRPGDLLCIRSSSQPEAPERPEQCQWPEEGPQQPGSALAASAPECSSSDRTGLIALVFRRLNHSGSGFLSEEDLRPFAEFTGFEGDAGAWTREHAGLCRELGCSPSGPGLEEFARLVNDSSSQGCYCSQEELLEFLASFGGGCSNSELQSTGPHQCAEPAGLEKATRPSEGLESQNQSTRVVHAVVAEAARVGGDIQVSIRHRVSPLPALRKASGAPRNTWPACQVELIPLGESHHCTVAALAELPAAQRLVRSLLLSGRVPSLAVVPALPWHSSDCPCPWNLNPSQEEAVRAALAGAVTLIHGPPGTGKTRTAAALALAFARANVARDPSACVLYAASGNQAVDVAAEALAALSVQRLEDLFQTQHAESEICSICWSEGCNVITFCGHVFHRHCLTQALKMAPRGSGRSCPLCRASLKSLEGVRILRVYSADTEGLDFPVPRAYLYKGVRERRRKAVPEGMRRFALHWRVHNKVPGHHNPHAAECERAYTEVIAEGPEGGGFEQARLRYRQTLEKARLFEVQSCNVLLITSCSSQRSFLRQLVQEERVQLRQVILDEAGTMTEPEALCPLTLSRQLERIVLAGDHRQLRPVVKSRDAATLGLSRSLFERLASSSAECAGAGPGPGPERRPEWPPSASSANASAAPMLRRELLQASVFSRLDLEVTGRLGREALRPFAEATGFCGSLGDWVVEYEALCGSLAVQEPGVGLSFGAFQRLLDDRSAEGCYCSEAELRQLLLSISTSIPPPPESASASAAPPAPPASVLLRQQYRMHPSLNSFPSRQFYASQVSDDVSTLERPEGLLLNPSGKPCALLFWACPTHFLEEVHEVANSGSGASVRSRANPQEAERCAELAEALAKALTNRARARAGDRSGSGSGTVSVALLSWYNAQVSELRQRTRARARAKDGHGDCAGLHCGSVVTAQGSEWDYVLLSTVRSGPQRPSPSLGSGMGSCTGTVTGSGDSEELPGAIQGQSQLGCLSDPHLLNVAVTRGRLGVVVLGNPAFLATNRHWKAFIRHCQQVGGLLTPEEKPEVMVASLPPP